MFVILDFTLGETFWGLLAIALTLIGIGIPYLLIMRGQHGDLSKMNELWRKMAQSAIDEKTAVLNRQATEVKSWKGEGKDITLTIDRIAADIRAVSRLKDAILDDQKERLASALRHLKDGMKKENYDTGKIDDVSKLLGL